MRVSKILCATLLCGMVGTAFGVPTPEDRKKLCEQNPDKFVWVERTQICLPKNPCLSGIAEIREVYCKGFPVLSQIVAERFIHEVYGNTDVRCDEFFEEAGEKFLPCRHGGDLYSVYRESHTGIFSDIQKAISAACVAYTAIDYVDDGNNGVKCSKFWGHNYKDCRDVADFASVLVGTVCRENDILHGGESYEDATNPDICHIVCDEKSK